MRFSRSRMAVTVGLAVMCLACRQEDKLFELLPNEESGINFVNTVAETDDFNIIDYLYFFNGGGVAVGDVNNDGLVDLYFSGNQEPNKLFLNKGNLKFEDISEAAGVTGNSEWNTGAVMADVNGDGLLDIYVCAVVGLKGLQGHNELYINNGDLTFTESASSYGLDLDTYSSSATFFDFDLDGDLDVYLLNHAVHTQESFGRASVRNNRSYETGDRLLRNDEGKFVDISDNAGIYGGINGYGLGVSVADFNADGYPDLYIGNDFHEDDYYYLNNGNGTFTERVKESFTHISRFSMGNDAADINHDGLPDLLTLDMLPDEERVLKSSEGDERLDILKLRTKEYGYHYQYARNMLHINAEDGRFREVGLLEGVAATDWSWSALFADFDLDGHQDLYVSNGIPRRPNDLDYIRFVSSEQIRNTMDATNLVDKQALDLMPDGIAVNKIFKGNGDASFDDKTINWAPNIPTYSTATALADLDNDGDLDVIASNVNDAPTILINQSSKRPINYLKIRLKAGKNTFGLGAKVYAYVADTFQMKEHFPIRGFQASSEPIVHFGLAHKDQIDSVVIVWPGGDRQVVSAIASNQLITIAKSPGSQALELKQLDTLKTTMFSQVAPSELGLAHVHSEDRYSDFDRLKLLPYQHSDRGPAVAIGDVNGDGLQDMFFGSSKHKTSELFLQTEKGFVHAELPELKKDSINEEVEAVIADLNGDGFNDLYVGTGGSDFYGKSKPLQDVLYAPVDGQFTPTYVGDTYQNTGCVEVADYDKDGFQDVFIGGLSIPNDFGRQPKSMLMRQHDGRLEETHSGRFQNLGMVTDASWVDLNQDGWLDLVIVGEWSAPTIFYNDQGTLSKATDLKAPSGLWQFVEPFDMDQDGDLDLVLGNWGLNSKFHADRKKPLRMYYGDFDENGSTETLLALWKEDAYYPIEGLDMLSKQLVFLRKKFTSYKAFAGKSMEEVFGLDLLQKAEVLEVEELGSGYLENNDGQFDFKPFLKQLQVAPLMAALVGDFDRDGDTELLLAGNYFGVQPYHGRMASFNGALIDQTKIISGNELGLDFYNQSIRHLHKLQVAGKDYLIVTVNDAPVQIYSYDQ